MWLVACYCARGNLGLRIMIFVSSTLTLETPIAFYNMAIMTARATALATALVAWLLLVGFSNAQECEYTCLSYASQYASPYCTGSSYRYDQCVCNYSYSSVLSYCVSKYPPCSTVGSSLTRSWIERCKCICSDQIADLLSCRTTGSIVRTFTTLTPVIQSSGPDFWVSTELVWATTHAIPDCLCDPSVDGLFLEKLSSCVGISSRVCSQYDLTEILRSRERLLSYCPGWTPSAPCRCGAVAARTVSCGGMTDASCLCAAETRNVFLASLSSCVRSSQYCELEQAQETAAALQDLCDLSYGSEGMALMAVVTVVCFAVVVMAAGYVFYRRRKRAGGSGGGDTAAGGALAG